MFYYAIREKIPVWMFVAIQVILYLTLDIRSNIFNYNYNETYSNRKNSFIIISKLRSIDCV